MWPNTVLTKRLKIDLPLIQAPMAGGIVTEKLVATVSNAGGLGSFAAGYLSPDEIQKKIRAIRSLTDKPFAVNLFIQQESVSVSDTAMEKMVTILQKVCSDFANEIAPVAPPYTYSFEAQAEIILEENIPVLSFTFGLLNEQWIKKFKQRHTVLIGTATTVAEAISLANNGVDIVVAQSVEAGGHRGTFLHDYADALIDLKTLLQQMKNAVDTPVVAAGGIMDANDIIAALKEGAAGVQMGTAFITSHESNAHPKYKEALLQAQQDTTTLTNAFTGKFARGLKNKFIEAMLPYQKEILNYPIQHALTKPIRDAAAKKSAIDFMSLWAGQGLARCWHASAREMIEKWHAEIKKILG